MNTNKALIFDFFGVICTEVAPRWIQKNLPNEDAQILHEKFVKNVDLGVAPNEKMFETLGGMVQKSSDQVQNEWQELISIDGELVSLIRELKKTKRIGLCSNAWLSFIRPILDAHDLNSLFDTLVISSEVGIVKPNPEIFLLVAEKLDFTPNQCIFVDDNPVNIKAAESIGMQGILYKTIQDLNQLS
jgi:putative hydrolase of the HAD superfamily